MNLFYIAVTLAVLLAAFILISLRATLKLNKKTHQYNELIKLYDEKKLQAALLEQRFADLLAKTSLLEQEKAAAYDKITLLEKQSSASAEKQNALNEKIAWLEKIKEDLTLKFKDISSEIVKAQHESFEASQKNTLSSILTPFADELKNFKKEVAAARDEGIKNKSSFDAQLTSLFSLNQTLAKEAGNLTEALKGSKKAQGSWGECSLNRLLEISGLRQGIDYDTQESFYTESNKLFRPDVIIRLPGKREVIVDSKVSLNNYLEAINAEDEKTKQDNLIKNLAALKAHIDELAAKEYQKLIKDAALNYVIMFIPVESAYIAALELDNALYDYAYKKNVILATPLSLLPTLRTIENLWRIDSQNKNVRHIAELGGKIYDKLANFIEDMKKLERDLSQASKAYQTAMVRLDGRGGIRSLAEDMKALGAKTAKNINLALNDNMQLLSDDTDSIENEEPINQTGE